MDLQVLRAGKPPRPLCQLPVLTLKGMNFDPFLANPTHLFHSPNRPSDSLPIMPSSHMWLHRRMRFIPFVNAGGSPWQRSAKYKQMCIKNKARTKCVRENKLRDACRCM